MRSWSAWSAVDLEGLNVTYERLELHHIGALPLTRAPPHYSREKYVLNASCGVPVINVHGVYEVKTGLGFVRPCFIHAQLQREPSLSPPSSTHIHLPKKTLCSPGNPRRQERRRPIRNYSWTRLLRTIFIL